MELGQLGMLVWSLSTVVGAFPGVGIQPVEWGHKKYMNSFARMECVKDYMFYYGDKYGNNYDQYKLEPVSNVSIAHYTYYVPKLDRKLMTPTVCFEFCRTIKGMQFFALKNGRDCYCEPFHTPMESDSSNCDAVCDGDNSLTCGGVSKSEVYYMHDLTPTPPPTPAPPTPAPPTPAPPTPPSPRPIKKSTCEKRPWNLCSDKKVIGNTLIFPDVMKGYDLLLAVRNENGLKVDLNHANTGSTKPTDGRCFGQIHTYGMGSAVVKFVLRPQRARMGDTGEAQTEGGWKHEVLYMDLDRPKNGRGEEWIGIQNYENYDKLGMSDEFVDATFPTDKMQYANGGGKWTWFKSSHVKDEVDNPMSLPLTADQRAAALSATYQDRMVWDVKLAVIGEANTNRNYMFAGQSSDSDCPPLLFR